MQQARKYTAGMYANIIRSCDGQHRGKTGWIHSPRKKVEGESDAAVILTTPQVKQPVSLAQDEQPAPVAQVQQPMSVPQDEQPRWKELRSNTRSGEVKKKVSFGDDRSPGPKSPKTSPNSAIVKPTKLDFDGVGQAAKPKKLDKKSTSVKKTEIKEASKKKEKRPRQESAAAFQKRVKQAEQALEKKFEKKMESKVKELKSLIENQAPPARDPVLSFST